MFVITGFQAKQLMVEMYFRGDIRDWKLEPRVANSDRVFKTCDIPTIENVQRARKNSYALALLEPPYAFLVDSIAKRRNSRLATCTVCQTKVPRHSLIRLDDDVYVVSPEFELLLEAARSADFPMLLFNAYEYCARYLYGGSGGISQHVEARTTVARLERYLSTCDHALGASKLVRVLRWTRDNAESPMECVLASMLCPPRRAGGYGLSDFVMNPEIQIPRSGGNRRPDIFFRDRRVGVEYDGGEVHDNPRGYARDRERRNDLVVADVKTVSVAREHIYSVTEMDKIAEKIEKLLGLRRHPISNETYGKRIQHQRGLLFALSEAQNAQ